MTTKKCKSKRLCVFYFKLFLQQQKSIHKFPPSTRALNFAPRTTTRAVRECAAQNLCARTARRVSAFAKTYVLVGGSQNQYEIHKSFQIII